MQSWNSDKEYDESGVNDNPPKVGSFYWVKPVFDVDFIPPGYSQSEDVPFGDKWDHWTQKEQPGLFLGYTKTGMQKWILLGQEMDEDDPWPICWQGKEIVAPF